MIKKEDVFKIGMFAKPHGIKGEITLITDCDLFEECPDDLFVVCCMDGILVPFFVEEYRYKNDTALLLKLEGVDSEEAAREFSGRDVYYPLELVDEASLVGDITWDNFLGFEVIDEDERLLGKITDVDDSTINVLLQIDYNGKNILLPAAEELVKEVDYEQKKMFVSLPEGLLAL